MKDTMKNEIKDLHEEVAIELIKRLRKTPNHAIMCYSDLCHLVDDRVTPRNIAYILGDLSAWCYNIGAPMISALIVNKETNMPGKGFYTLYTDLYGKRVSEDEELEIFIGEVNKVLAYNQWDQLEEYLGI